MYSGIAGIFTRNSVARPGMDFVITRAKFQYISLLVNSASTEPWGICKNLKAQAWRSAPLGHVTASSQGCCQKYRCTGYSPTIAPINFSLTSLSAMFCRQATQRVMLSDASVNVCSANIFYRDHGLNLVCSKSIIKRGVQKPTLRPSRPFFFFSAARARSDPDIETLT